LNWTGERWVITLTKGNGEKSFSETQLIKKKGIFKKEKNSEVYKKFKDIFLDGNLVEVKKKD